MPQLHTHYESMNSGFGRIPIGENAKLLIRHSIRPSLKGEKNPDHVNITTTGYDEAYRMGASIPMELGFCSTSPIQRCMDTMYALTNGRNKEIHISELLGYSFVEKADTAALKFTQFSLKEIAFQMSLSKQDGFINASEGIRMLLDFIFSSGGEKGHMDIYCTHDLQLALMDMLIFGSYRDIQETRDNWPQMLEGMWLWGKRNDFQICWRNQLKHCVQYLPSI